MLSGQSGDVRPVPEQAVPPYAAGDNVLYVFEFEHLFWPPPPSASQAGVQLEQAPYPHPASMGGIVASAASISAISPLQIDFL